MRILIIEDEIDLADTISRSLTKAGFPVDGAYDGAEGYELACIYEYDLLILDINLPGINGLEICQALRKTNSKLLILILSARSEPEDRIIGLNLGADDYLVKPFHFGELLARIQALLRRDLGDRAMILSYKNVKLDPNARTAWLDNRKLILTRKEFAILEYLMRDPGKVISQEELLEHVWNTTVNPFTNVVRVHINSLRKKLGDDPKNPQFITTIIGEGYAIPTEENSQKE
jgi:DNA-binding response OmpR family regulator